MAKEQTPLPYFKFVIAEYDMGDITECSLAAQGLFINLCVMYWKKRGDLPFGKAVKKFPRKLKHFNELLDEGIIKLNEDQIEINFLSEQLEELGAVSSTNSNNAKSGWNKRKANAVALQTQVEGTAEKCNIEEEKEQEEDKEEEQEKEPVALEEEIKLLSKEARELKESICGYFAIKPILTSKLYSSIDDFVETVRHRNELKIAAMMLQKYMAYKARSREAKHNVMTWIGTKAEFYNDGQWKIIDWDSKLNEINKNAQTQRTHGATGSQVNGTNYSGSRSEQTASVDF